MKIRDLIRALSQFPPGVEVYLKTELGESQLGDVNMKLERAEVLHPNAASWGIQSRPERVVVYTYSEES